MPEKRMDASLKQKANEFRQHDIAPAIAQKHIQSFAPKNSRAEYHNTEFEPPNCPNKCQIVVSNCTMLRAFPNLIGAPLPHNSPIGKGKGNNFAYSLQQLAKNQY